MKIESFPDHGSMSEKAAELVYFTLKEKPNALICTASGNSTVETYQMLANKYLEDQERFRALTVLKLDEWGGVPMDHPSTCETYLQELLIRPLKISASNYISFQSDPIDKEEECKRISRYLTESGPIDVCILGLGVNGHIAFNEPGDFLSPDCHIAELSENSLQHAMVAQLEQKPSYGLSVGMGDILKSKQIILLVTGKNKDDVTKEFFLKKITTRLPASLLWLHPNVICLVNEADIQV